MTYKIENATTEMLNDEILTADLAQKITEIVNSAAEKFQNAHPLIAASFNFEITLHDGAHIVTGGIKLDSRKRAKIIRKHRESVEKAA